MEASCLIHEPECFSIEGSFDKTNGEKIDRLNPLLVLYLKLPYKFLG